MGIGVVIIVYHPDMGKLNQNIVSIMEVCEKIIVIDNTEGTSLDKDILKLWKNITYISNENNIGIAAALNMGMRILWEDGYEWGLTLDQDSVCPPEFIIEAKKYITDMTVAILCPQIKYTGWHDNTDRKYTYNIETVKACMTSGSLTRISAWREVDGFDEAFFIDYIDNDFCEKLKQSNYKIMQLNKIVMSHELGESSEKHFLWFCIKFSHHEPWRYYYMIRNHIIFIQRYHTTINVYKECLKVFYTAFLGLLFEQDRKETLINILRGMKEAGIVQRMEIEHI